MGLPTGRLSTGNCESIRDERRSAVRVSPSDIELGLIRIKENEIYASSFRIICLLIQFFLTDDDDDRKIQMGEKEEAMENRKVEKKREIKRDGTFLFCDETALDEVKRDYREEGLRVLKLSHLFRVGSVSRIETPSRRNQFPPSPRVSGAHLRVVTSSRYNVYVVDFSKEVSLSTTTLMTSKNCRAHYFFGKPRLAASS